MRVKVWNDNVHDLKERFKGDEILIKAKGFIEMDLYEASDFKGQYHPIVQDANGLQDPKSYKMIRIEKPSDGKLEDTSPKHVCMSCKKSYESEPVLKAHIDTAHASDERLEIPELDEKISKRSKKAS